ncbi:hypothetical protein [Kaistella carnis]|uniref:hypothetical protein n=1 Tax=Kaistella carnis TaxID=1241979 RepID=UPI00289E9406|nr:hypothetical protein [Kaistella carnis]
MKKIAFIAAVVFTTLSIQSCREADDIFSPEEVVTLKRVQDLSDANSIKKDADTIDTEQAPETTSNLDVEVDGEIAAPPKK